MSIVGTYPRSFTEALGASDSITIERVYQISDFMLPFDSLALSSAKTLNPEQAVMQDLPSLQPSKRIDETAIIAGNFFANNQSYMSGTYQVRDYVGSNTTGT